MLRWFSTGFLRPKKCISIKAHAQNIGAHKILLESARKFLVLAGTELRDDYSEGCRKATV